MSTICNEFINSSRRLTCLLFARIRNELVITRLLLRSNATQSILHFYVHLTARLIAFPSFKTSVTPRLFCDLSVAALAYGYTFDIINQTASVAEDAINKPYRPIPAGLLTVGQARSRCFLSVLLSPLLIGALSGKTAACWMLCWELWVIFCYAWPKPNSWIIRSGFSALGQVMLLRLLNEVVRNHLPTVDVGVGLDFVSAAHTIATIHIQEFHDIDGDAKSGRRTLPIILSSKGVVYLRQITATIFLTASPLLFAWGLARCPAGGLLSVHLIGILYMAASLVTAIRVVLGSPETKMMDENTYKCYYAVVSFSLGTYLVQMDGETCN